MSGAMRDGQCLSVEAGHVLEVAWFQLFVHQCFELKGMTVYRFMYMALRGTEQASFWPHLHMSQI